MLIFIELYNVEEMDARYFIEIQFDYCYYLQCLKLHKIACVT